MGQVAHNWERDTNAQWCRTQRNGHAFGVALWKCSNCGAVHESQYKPEPNVWVLYHDGSGVDYTGTCEEIIAHKVMES